MNVSTAQRQVDRLVSLGLVRGVNERRRAVIADIVAQMPPEEHGVLVHALEAFAVAAGEPEELMSGAARYGW